MEGNIMKSRILSFCLVLAMLLTVVPLVDNHQVEAKPKKGSVVKIKGKPYIYQGKVKKHFPKKYCKLVNKYSKKSQSFTNFVGGTSGFASVAKKSGYAGVLSSSLYIANFGVQNNTKVYKKAAKKGTGVTVSYDLYVPKTGGNYSLVRNQKVAYK